MLIFSVSSCTTHSNASFILSKAHSEPVTSFLKVFWYSSHGPFFQSVKPLFIIDSLQSVSWQHLTCSKYFLTDESCCHWPCIHVCFSSSASCRNFFAFDLSQDKSSHIPRRYGSFSIIFYILHRYAFFSCLHCTFVSGSSSFACKCLLKHFWPQVGRECFITFINHYRRQLPMAEGLFAALLVTAKQGALTERLPRSVRKSSLLLPQILYSFLLSHSLSASPSGPNLHSPSSIFLASSQPGQAISSSFLGFLTLCSLFASSFSFWYIHESCSFAANCKASSVFLCSNSVICQLIWSCILSLALSCTLSLPSIAFLEYFLSFVQHLYFTTYVLTPSFQVD